MKAKTTAIIFVTTIVALMWCSSAWADRSNMRGDRQTQRIRQGIRSGEITRPEARRLKKEQRRIHRAYGQASADGHLDRRERRHLNKMQDRAGRHIYRSKHNRLRQRPNRHYHHGNCRGYGHRRTVAHNHDVSCYYPAMVSGYGFSVGVSDTGWQFAFSGSDSR